MGHVLYGAQLGGAATEKVFAIEDPEHQDAKRRAVFDYARRMTASPPTVTKAVVEALRPHLTDKEIVELTYFVCRYNTMNRLAEAWGVPLERENLWRPKGSKGPKEPKEPKPDDDPEAPKP